MSRNVNFWGQGNKASVSGEERANILLLACCYQQGSRRWLDINPLGRQKLARLFDVVDPGRLDTDVHEPGTFELLDILGFLHGGGNAAHPEFDVAPDLRLDFTADHDVGHCQTAAR